MEYYTYRLIEHRQLVKIRFCWFFENVLVQLSQWNQQCTSSQVSFARVSSNTSTDSSVLRCSVLKVQSLEFSPHCSVFGWLMQNTGPKGCPIAVSFSVTAQHSTAGNGRHKGKHNHTLWNSSSKTKNFFYQSLAENQLIVCNINVKKLTTNTKAKAVLFSTGRLYLSS